MRAYELMIIFDGDLEEAAVAASLSKATAAIEAEGGRVATTLDSPQDPPPARRRGRSPRPHGRR
jgi:hypothetical protein